MSPRRVATVAGADLSFHLRRASFLVWLVLLLVLAWGLSTGNARISSGDSSVGGKKAFITSEFAVAKQVSLIIPIVYGFFIAVYAGMAVLRDEESGVTELVHSTPLRPGEYVFGKYLAVLGGVILVLALNVAAMVFFNHGTPSDNTQEFRGPLVIANYVRPSLIFGVPTIVFFTGLAFLVGELTRRPVLVFIMPLVVLIGCVTLLWEWSPAWLDPRIDRLMMLVDPAGQRWLRQTYLKVDRGVDFYNTAPVVLDGLFVANRLLMLALGIGAVLLSRTHYAATLRGVSRAAEKRWHAAGAAAPEKVAAPPASRPLATLGMTSRRPGLIAGALAVMSAEVAELRSSPALYLFFPLLVIQAVGSDLLATGWLDSTLLVTPGSFAMRALPQLSSLLCLLLLFYTVESLWRERRTGLAPVALATPLRTGSILLGKILADALVAWAVLLLIFVSGAIAIAVGGTVRFQMTPFLIVWSLLLLPKLVAWVAFVTVGLSLTRGRYATYSLALGVFFFTAFRFVISEMNWVGNWPLWGIGS